MSGDSYTCLFIQIYLSIQLEWAWTFTSLHYLYGDLMDPMQNAYNVHLILIVYRLSVKILSFLMEIN